VPAGAEVVRDSPCRRLLAAARGCGRWLPAGAALASSDTDLSKSCLLVGPAVPGCGGWRVAASRRPLFFGAACQQPRGRAWRDTRCVDCAAATPRGRRPGIHAKSTWEASVGPRSCAAAGGGRTSASTRGWRRQWRGPCSGSCRQACGSLRRARSRGTAGRVRRRAGRRAAGASDD
jgi:hypothetical protein